MISFKLEEILNWFQQLNCQIESLETINFVSDNLKKMCKSEVFNMEVAVTQKSIRRR